MLTLCATGITMGFVHVLTGADHLSAIATLSANIGNCRAFWYGIRWGVGHSIGLVLVGSIFIALENVQNNNNNNGSSGNHNSGDGDESVDESTRSIEIPEPLENVAACFVGFFMLGLGFYNLYRANLTRRERKKRRRHSHGHGRDHCHHKHCDHPHDDENDDQDGTGKLSCEPLTATTIDIDSYVDQSKGSSMNRDEEEQNAPKLPSSPSSSMDIDNDVSSRKKGIVSKKFLSLGIGLAHGVAGPGGVLGVVPAVRLHNIWYSVAYLGSFCVSSIAVMGAFAALYGSLSEKWSRDDDKLAYRIEVFSASLSILVGCTWLTLLYLGILQQVFP